MELFGQLCICSSQATEGWVEGEDFLRSVLFSGCLSALLSFPRSLPHYLLPGRMFANTPGNDVCRSAGVVQEPECRGLHRGLDRGLHWRHLL